MPFTQQPALQLIYETAPIGLAFLSLDCRYLHINQRLTEICGISVEGHLGRTVRECVPGLANTVEAIVRSIMKTGKPVTGIEVAGQRADQGEDRAWITYWHPLEGPAGEIVGINVAAEEITERKRAEAALKASEQQFRTLADAMPQLVWMAEADGRIFWFNRHWHDYTGTGDRDTRDWLAFLAPGSQPDAGYCWTQSLKAETALEIETPLRSRDGGYRPFLTRVIPLRDVSCAVYRWIGTHVDISEQHRREEHIRFIIDELSHRTKNLLAVVIAIANQTAQYAGDVPQYRTYLVERLRALAHCHDLLVKDNWQGASFRDLVASQMRPFGETSAGRIDAAGPDIVLKPDAVQHLGLALHELATNASKHGALSDTGGRVSIRWEVVAAGAIRIHWRETAGPPVRPPQRQGFGHIVIEQIVPRALKGDGRLDFAAAGVTWTFEFRPGDNR
ncbi:MAG: PAS domain-containing protein [Rhizomicrobium sp.]